MGIRFLCPNCHNKVHVKDRLAGLRGFCPTCGAKINIPYRSMLPAKAGDPASDNQPNGRAMLQGAAAPSTAAMDMAAHSEMSVSAILPRVGRLVAVHMNPPADPLAGAVGPVWYVVPPEGTEPFGPADSATLNLWLQQGRIISRSLVWRQDWPEWRKAGTVWSHLAMNDVDPRLQRSADRVRGTTAQNNGPQFASPRVPSSPSLGAAHPATQPGHTGAAPGTLMSQMQQTAGGPAARPQTAMPANPAATRSPMTAIPASHPHAAAPGAASPGFGPPPDGLYYPQRSQRWYWAIVGVLLIGLVGMSVALFYVLDQMKRHKEQSQPAATETIDVDEPQDDSKKSSAVPTGSPTGKKPSGKRSPRTTNP